MPRDPTVTVVLICNVNDAGNFINPAPTSVSETLCRAGGLNEMFIYLHLTPPFAPPTSPHPLLIPHPICLLPSPVGFCNQKENAGKYKLLLLKCLFAENFHLVRQPTLHRIWNQLGFAFMSVPWQFHPFVSHTQWIFRVLSSGLVYNKIVNVTKVSLQEPPPFLFLESLFELHTIVHVNKRCRSYFVPTSVVM